MFVTTRFSNRRRTAMHVLEIVSMLLVVALSIIVPLPDRHDYCICNYRLESRGFIDDSGRLTDSSTPTTIQIDARARGRWRVAAPALLPRRVTSSLFKTLGDNRCLSSFSLQYLSLNLSIQNITYRWELQRRL